MVAKLQGTVLFWQWTTNLILYIFTKEKPVVTCRYRWQRMVRCVRKSSWRIHRCPPEPNGSEQKRESNVLGLAERSIILLNVIAVFESDGDLVHPARRGGRCGATAAQRTTGSLLLRQADARLSRACPELPATTLIPQDARQLLPTRLRELTGAPGHVLVPPLIHRGHCRLPVPLGHLDGG